jgi:hypothetical protein
MDRGGWGGPVMRTNVSNVSTSRVHLKQRVPERTDDAKSPCRPFC